MSHESTDGKRVQLGLMGNYQMVLGNGRELAGFRDSRATAKRPRRSTWRLALPHCVLLAGSVAAVVVWPALAQAASSAEPGPLAATHPTVRAHVAPDPTGNVPSAQPQRAVPRVTTAVISINPGEDIQDRVKAAPLGAAFLLKAGIHRLQTITPKSTQTFSGEPGAILSGARLLTAFGRVGEAWVASGQTQEGSAAGQCKPEWPRCSRPEDLFIDNVMLKHVDSRSGGGPGRWYFDYGSDTIYIWDNPTGRTVETSVTTNAFTGTASSVTIKNLIVEKYANPAQTGAIRGGSAWTIQDNEVRWNHGIGVQMAQDRKVLRNNVHHNGEMGIGGSSVNGLVEGNEIAYNNTAGFNPYWEGGGTKFTYSARLMVRENFVHHNNGLGLWTDIDNINVTYEYNRVEDNTESGISHEISYQAVIRYNTIKRNGSDRPWPHWVEGSGIVISNSRDVEVYGNTLEDNWQGIFAIDMARGAGGYGVWTLMNIYIHDNIINATKPLGDGSGRSGVAGDSGTKATNVRFEGNTYALGPYSRYFAWINADRTEAEWRELGNDVSGVFRR